MRIELKSLCKSYGSLKVLDQISLNIQPGQVVALLGSNGAGKTTLLRCMAGIPFLTTYAVIVTLRLNSHLEEAFRIALTVGCLILLVQPCLLCIKLSQWMDGQSLRGAAYVFGEAALIVVLGVASLMALVDDLPSVERGYALATCAVASSLTMILSMIYYRNRRFDLLRAPLRPMNGAFKAP